MPWAAVMAGPLLLFGPMLLRGRALFWGAPLLQFTPWRTAALRILRSGHLPLWNPWLGAGAPLLANYQSGLLYPPNLLLLLTDVAWGQTALVMLHLMWAGAGMLFLARRLRLGALGQGVAAAAFALGGYLVARSGFLSMNAAAAWLPWALLAVDHGADPGSLSGWRRMVTVPILAVVLGMQWLAGHAQLAWYTAVLAGMWSLWRGWGAAGWLGAVRAAGRLLAAAALAFGLAAAQLIPTLQYLSQSGRSGGLDPGFALTYSFWPWRLLGLLAPDLFGNPAHGNYWGYANYWEDAIYIGVLPLALAALGLLTRAPGLRRARWLLAAATGAGLLLGLGDNTPVFPFLFRHVPAFDLFQAPTRWTMVAVVAMALLAGMGADRWNAPGPRATYWLRLGTVGAGTIFVVARLAPGLIPELEPTLAPAVARAGLLLALCGGLALLRPARRSLGWDAAALALVLVDLLAFGHPLIPAQPLALQQAGSPAQSGLSDGHRIFLAGDLEHALKFDRHFRFDSFQPGHDWSQVRAAALPNATILDGLSSANNFDPLVPARYTAYLQSLESAGADRRAALLDLLDVGWEAVERSSGVRYEPRPAAQRARWVAAAEWTGGPQQALERLLDPSHDPAQVVVLEGAPTPDPTEPAARASTPDPTEPAARASTPAPAEPGGHGVIRLLPGDDPGRVELQVQAETGGWAVLHDIWYPGWRADLDGEDTPIVPADGLFRAVWVPPGNHHIVFQYPGRIFWIPAGLSAAVWAGVVLWLVRAWRGRVRAET